jgi:hypothetical protein
MNDSLNEARALILKHHSGPYTHQLAAIIVQKPELFDLFWIHYLSLEEPVSRRAAWAITHAVEERPALITSQHLGEALRLTDQMSHDGEKRCLAKVLSLVDIPEALYGEIVELCFRWLSNTSESIAVRVYSMDTLFKLCRPIPEITGELAATIAHHMDRFSPGLKNKGAKLLKRLKMKV